MTYLHNSDAHDGSRPVAPDLGDNERRDNSPDDTEVGTRSVLPPEVDSSSRKYNIPSATTPDRSLPQEHTMGPENFRKYIGRYRENGPSGKMEDGNTDILCKKFSDEQKLYLAEAYREGAIVRVMGAWHSDIGTIAVEFNKVAVEYNMAAVEYNKDMKVVTHSRSGKTFNINRARMVWMRHSSDNSGETVSRELWVIIFPSRQYVDQMAELIQAIFDDFTNCGAVGFENPVVSPVLVWHFGEIEKSVARWTDLETSITAFVRHGDIVVIGNVELLLPGIEAVGYYRKFGDWQRFGLDKMFGIEIMINSASGSRIVLLGVTESYWGEASAHYVAALLKGGARHILYGSKAASMITRKDVARVRATGADEPATASKDNADEPVTASKDNFARVRSPGSFSIYVRNKVNQGLTGINSTLTSNEALQHLAEQMQVETAGVGVTVPTVVGENHDQRTRLDNLNPSTMDNEDGHIARVVQDHNRRFPERGDHAGFLPVHYLSDYINRRHENVDLDVAHLAETNPDIRDPAFRRIGSFFGIYGTIYGSREYVSFPKKLSVTPLPGEAVTTLLTRVHYFLNAGLVREAITYLGGNYHTEYLPSANLQAIALICQRYGFVDDSLTTLAELQSRDEGSRGRLLSDEERLRMRVVQIKLDTQVGRFVKARNEANELIKAGRTLTLLKEHGLFRAVQRRIGVAAASHGDTIAAKKAFKAARHDDPYDAASTDLFRCMASLGPGEYSIPNWDTLLSEIRHKYLTLPSTPVWRANKEKGALTALFVEAAIYLTSRGPDDHRGLIRLFIAHLLNLRNGGSERSEGYGELIALIRDDRVRDLVRRAMRMDGPGRKEFQQTSHSAHLLLKAQESLLLLDLPVEQREVALQEMLSRLDDFFDGASLPTEAEGVADTVSRIGAKPHEVNRRMTKTPK